MTTSATDTLLWLSSKTKSLTYKIYIENDWYVKIYSTTFRTIYKIFHQHMRKQLHDQRNVMKSIFFRVLIVSVSRDADISTEQRKRPFVQHEAFGLNQNWLVQSHIEKSRKVQIVYSNAEIGNNA